MPTQPRIPLDGITILTPDEAAAYLDAYPCDLSQFRHHINGAFYKRLTFKNPDHYVPARDLPALPDGVRIVMLEDRGDEQEIKAHRAALKQLKQDGYTTVRHLFASDASMKVAVYPHGSIGQIARRAVAHVYADAEPGQFVAFIAVNEELAGDTWAEAYGYDHLLEAAWWQTKAHNRKSSAVVKFSSGHIAYGFIDEHDFALVMPQVVAACGQGTSETLTITQACANAQASIDNFALCVADFTAALEVQAEHLNQALAHVYYLAGNEHDPFTSV